MCEEKPYRSIRTAFPSSRSMSAHAPAYSGDNHSRIENDGESTKKTSTRTADRKKKSSATFDSSNDFLRPESYRLESSYHSKYENDRQKSASPRISRDYYGSSDFADDPQQATLNRNARQQATTDYSVHQQVEHSYIDHYRTNESRFDGVQQFGLIILGNSGVGKSFLGNILLGREAFVHEFSSGSVTHSTEFWEVQIGSLILAIFNIPGLIEADQQRINLNKREIEKAFLTRPNSIILYVFGNQRGRLRDEDILAFKAINAAYSFRRESLVLVMNDLDKDRPSNYEGTTIVLLQQLLPDTEINERNVCFLNRIQGNNPEEKQVLKEQLLQVAVRFIPKIHRKKQEIQTTYDQLEAEKRKIKMQQTKFNQERSNFMSQIKKSQALLNETMANHQTEAESYRKAIEKQERMLLIQQEKFEEERRQYNSQLRELRNKVDQTQTYYEKLRRNGTGDEEKLRRYEERLRRYEEDIKILRKSQADLNKRVPTQNTKNSSCVIS